MTEETDHLDIQGKLRVYAATGMACNLSPNMCRLLADRIDAGLEAYGVGLEMIEDAKERLSDAEKKLRKAKSDLAYGIALFVLGVIIAILGLQF